MQEITTAEQSIRERIQRRGRISFAEFMQTALYHPIDGYYSSAKPFGATGDYYTSPAAHPAFGALLALELFALWRCMGSPSDFTVVEMGAGNGLLADDICRYAADLPAEFARKLRYVCIDRYSSEAASDAEWLRAVDMPLHGVVGCFISNEFVDALPVHRFRMVGGEALEVYVALDDSGEFVEMLGRPSTPLLQERLNSLGFTLTDGHCGEVNLLIKPWIDDMARALDKGFVITIDYGYEATELYSHARRFGTLQTYYRHTEGSSAYQRIGRQDISAHVDFSLIQSEGNAAGLKTLAYTTQGELLRSLGLNEMLQHLRSVPMEQRERNANMMAMRELMNPDGLGGFKALIQEKATGIAELPLPKPLGALLRGARTPLLSARHMPLMEGRYPHTSWETPSLWDDSWQSVY